MKTTYDHMKEQIGTFASGKLPDLTSPIEKAGEPAAPNMSLAKRKLQSKRARSRWDPHVRVYASGWGTAGRPQSGEM